MDHDAAHFAAGTESARQHYYVIPMSNIDLSGEVQASARHFVRETKSFFDETNSSARAHSSRPVGARRSINSRTVTSKAELITLSVDRFARRDSSREPSQAVVEVKYCPFAKAKSRSSRESPPNRKSIFDKKTNNYYS